MAMIECPNHAGSFDCNPFCPLCEGEQEYEDKEITSVQTKCRCEDCDAVDIYTDGLCEECHEEDCDGWLERNS